MTDFFKTWCREAFHFLLEYGFIEETLPKGKYTNPFQVIYSNSTIKLQILGEGYGSIASVYFITPDNGTVHYSQLDPETISSTRTKNENLLSQKDQIYKIAEHIQNNHREILLGNYSTLYEKADLIAKDRKKMIEGLKLFSNDPEAQAERAARVAASEAGKAYKNKDYQKFIEILEPHDKYLSAKQKSRLEFAKAQLIEE